MHKFSTFITAAFLSFAVGATPLSVKPFQAEEIVEHGGGCRKNSPVGTCCHMETRTGIVHCH
jgi:hypothetical protein